MNDITQVLDEWLNNSDYAYSEIVRFDSDEELQDYVEELLTLGTHDSGYPGALVHGIIRDFMGLVEWRKLFESIKGI
jgi:hypothetical protein